ncbi:MAG: DUF1320 domain-containing protein [Prevotellaceae bacterium]|jgi:phage gp36-like protein|nr:DUF1320 domain-containing protein [Prevotellaceae bacterium]
MYLSIEDITKGMRAEVLAVITRSDDEVVQQAINEAMAEVTAYLSARYDIAAEFAKTSNRATMVAKIVRDIAIYNCHCFSAPVNIPKNRETAYENAIKFLRDVQAEKASIPDLARLTTAPDGTVSSNYLYFSGNPKRDHHI